MLNIHARYAHIVFNIDPRAEADKWLEPIAQTTETHATQILPQLNMQLKHNPTTQHNCTNNNNKTSSIVDFCTKQSSLNQ